MRFRIGITLVRPSVVSDRLDSAEMYLRWYLETLCRIPVVTRSSEDFSYRQMCGPNGSAESSLVILLHDCDVKNPKPLDLDCDEISVPILATFGTASSLQDSHLWSKAFGRTRFLERSRVRAQDLWIRVCDNQPREVAYPARKDSYSHRNTQTDVERVELLQTDSGFQTGVLVRYCNVPVAITGRGLSYVGVESVTFPRTDGHLEVGRASFYLRILEEAIGTLCPGLPRLRLSRNPVSLRLDDPPANWEFLNSERLFRLDTYSDLLHSLKDLEPCLTIMFTPFLATNQGDLKWTDPQIPKEIAEIAHLLRIEAKNGKVELGLHGCRHLTIGYFPKDAHKAVKRILIHLRKALLSREFYDSLRRIAIPEDEQRGAIDCAISEHMRLFGQNPIAFTPPAHNWDESTLSILAELGFSCFSGDCNFIASLPGAALVKTPFPTGSVFADRLVSVSATIVGGWEEEDLKEFSDRGIPILIASHCYRPSTITALGVDRLKKGLAAEGRLAPMLLTQAGALINLYRRSRIEGWIDSDGSALIDFESPVPVDLILFGNPLKPLCSSIVGTSHHELRCRQG